MENNTSRRILIADDEPLARERLRRLVEKLPGYQVCGEAEDGHSTLNAVAELDPDIVLLDIRMPGMDGMQAAAQLAALEKPPALIFCTAYDHYAIHAFEVQAVAYLLKPVRREALADALERAARVNRLQLQAVTESTRPGSGQLAVKTHRGTELIDLDQILFCEADQKYVTIHHTGGETVTDYTLKELETSYPELLLRIHRHTLVATGYIRGLTRTEAGQQRVTLQQDTRTLPVSRRHAPELRKWLKDHGPGQR